MRLQSTVACCSAKHKLPPSSLAVLSCIGIKQLTESTLCDTIWPADHQEKPTAVQPSAPSPVFRYRISQHTHSCSTNLCPAPLLLRPPRHAQSDITCLKQCWCSSALWPSPLSRDNKLACSGIAGGVTPSMLCKASTSVPTTRLISGPGEVQVHVSSRHQHNKHF